MKLVVVSHALVQEVSRARWYCLAERHPVEVHLLVPSCWESTWFGNRTVWRPAPIHEGRFFVHPLPVSSRRSWGAYTFLSTDARLRRIRPNVIYVIQEEFSLVLQQMITYRQLWARSAQLLFFSWNNLGIPTAKWWQRTLWNRTCKETDVAIAGNIEVGDVLRRAGYSKRVAIQTEIGVDEKAFFPDAMRRASCRGRLGLRGFAIGFAGRLTEAKGVSDLIEASLRLQGDWQLLLVGDGELRPTIQARFFGLGLSDRLRCTGQVPPDGVPDLMRAMDCLVLPSRTTSAWKEQFGLVLAQAMACGVPVVGSDSGAIPEVIGDGGLVFREGDVTGLSATLSRLMAYPDALRELGRKGLERAAKKFSAQGLADEFYSLLCAD